jgi:hypothetical protein
MLGQPPVGVILERLHLAHRQRAAHQVAPQVVGKRRHMPVGVGLADFLADFVVAKRFHVSAQRGDGGEPPQQVVSVLGRLIERVGHGNAPHQGIVHRGGGRAVRVLGDVEPTVRVIPVGGRVARLVRHRVQVAVAVGVADGVAVAVCDGRDQPVRVLERDPTPRHTLTIRERALCWVWDRGSRWRGGGLFCHRDLVVKVQAADHNRQAEGGVSVKCFL